MTRDRNPTPWALVVLAACLAVTDTLRAADSLLTVGRLFGTKEFDAESLPAQRWSKKSSTFFTLEKGELARHDPATGKTEVAAPPSPSPRWRINCFTTRSTRSGTWACRQATRPTTATARRSLMPASCGATCCLSTVPATTTATTRGPSG